MHQAVEEALQLGCSDVAAIAYLLSVGDREQPALALELPEFRAAYREARREVLFQTDARMLHTGLTVTSPLTASLSPSNPTVGVTQVNLGGTATPGATVTPTAALRRCSCHRNIDGA